MDILVYILGSREEWSIGASNLVCHRHPLYLRLQVCKSEQPVPRQRALLVSGTFRFCLELQVYPCCCRVRVLWCLKLIGFQSRGKPSAALAS
jgi:hypothetical protein